MKILAVTCIYPSLENPHEGTFIANRVNQLNQNGAELMVLKRDHLSSVTFLNDWKRVQIFYKYPNQYRYVWDDIPVHRQGLRFMLPLDYSKTAARTTYLKIRPTIKKLYLEFPFDVIYLATWGDLSLAVSRISKEMGVPYVASAIGDHTNNYYNKPGSLYYEYHKEIFENSEFVTCVSRDMENKVKILTADTANTFAFYSGVNTLKFFPSDDMRRAFRDKMGYRETDIVILFVGRVSHAKGIYELLEAFAHLKGQHRKIKLLIIGAPDKRQQINNKITSYRIQDDAQWIGAVSHDEIPGYLNAADIFVLPSWNEGMPNVIMEACACKTPVLASNVGGIPEIISDGETGYLFEPRNILQLRDKLDVMITGRHSLKRIAETAYSKVLTTFNYHKNGKLLYEKIVGTVKKA